LLLHNSITESAFLSNIRVKGGLNTIVRNSNRNGRDWDNNVFFHKMTDGSIIQQLRFCSESQLNDILRTLIYINLGESPPTHEFVTCHLMCKKNYFIVLYENYFKENMLQDLKENAPAKTFVIRCRTIDDVRNVVMF
jgi:hypothetical protein